MCPVSSNSQVLPNTGIEEFGTEQYNEFDDDEVIIVDDDELSGPNQNHEEMH